MAKVKQGIISKKKAINKNKKSKYTYIANKTITQTASNGKQTTKYAYTKKILVNGKYKYYYS